MNKFRKVLLVAAPLLALAATEASAYTCYAGSPTGSWGWGRSSSLSYAKQRALLECAVRTPRNYYCHLTRCTR